MVAHPCARHEEGQGKEMAGVSDYWVCHGCLKAVSHINQMGLCDECAADALCEGVSD
jgi:hypothetical protein